jgi:GR25 family glycosyltransferase involved in LPS biosynthesis
MDLFDVPVYVINLDRRADRWAEFQRLEGIGAFKHLRRWSATDGRMIDISANTQISIHTRSNIARNMRRSHHEINTVGAIGASYSHYRIWKDLVSSGAKGCIVFEDDVYLDPEILQRARSAFAHAPHCDLFLFGTHKWNYVDKPYSGSYMEVMEFNGAHAYYITRSCAEQFLREFFPIEMHVEFYMYLMARTHGLRILRHKDVRVSYMSEVSGVQDSDTYFGDETCPLCVVPDTIDGVYMTYGRLREHVATLGAVAFVLAGYFLGRKGA